MKILHFITGIQCINLSVVTLEVLNFPDRHLIQFWFPLINDRSSKKRHWTEKNISGSGFIDLKSRTFKSIKKERKREKKKYQIVYNNLIDI